MSDPTHALVLGTASSLGRGRVGGEPVTGPHIETDKHPQSPINLTACRWGGWKEDGEQTPHKNKKLCTQIYEWGPLRDVGLGSGSYRVITINQKVGLWPKRRFCAPSHCLDQSFRTITMSTQTAPQTLRLICAFKTSREASNLNSDVFVTVTTFYKRLLLRSTSIYCDVCGASI